MPPCKILVWTKLKTPHSHSHTTCLHCIALCNTSDVDNGSHDKHAGFGGVNCCRMSRRQWYQTITRLNPHPLLSSENLELLITVLSRWNKENISPSLSRKKTSGIFQVLILIFVPHSLCYPMPCDTVPSYNEAQWWMARVKYLLWICNVLIYWKNDAEARCLPLTVTPNHSRGVRYERFT